ncbi:sensor histidine kinase [Telluribacter sp.]|jgi:sensor histidine kinase YesM|uniref:sensor histidine kinase n=1 Tax=Telluribacter sp. TaxID=1978767 RepID=UPI002E14F282|nr:histidine kinase [Telluribacter sp.]
MTSFSLSRNFSLLIHVLVWGVLGLSLLLFQPLTWRVELPSEFWIKQAVLFSLLVTVFYLNYLLLVPRLLLRNRLALFITLNVITVFIVAFLIQRVEVWINLREMLEKAYRARAANGVVRSEKWIDFFSLILALMVLGISTSVTAVQNWQRDMQLRQNLEREKTKSELSFLKAQINPHFFFNTLNNIYALTIVDGEAAREALHKLSRMMRYVLYETQNSTVMLSNEIAFVQDYIQLMKLRLTDKVTVKFEQPSPLHDVPIAPMLLLPFIENAFKHGVSAIEPSSILIAIRQHGKQLHLEVQNSVFTEKKVTLDDSNGIGLVNTRRRLDLLYPDGYKLAVDESTPDNKYRVHLKLEVA